MSNQRLDDRLDTHNSLHPNIHPGLTSEETEAELKKRNDILMGKESIPKAVKSQVEEIVTEFNKKWFRGSKHCYLVRFRGRFAYLDRFEYEELRPICRVEFGGKIDNWDFAIYKYSSGRYDPEEFLFPGSDCADGTIEGAMKAGLEAYPP